METIVWRWKAQVTEYIGKPGVLDVKVAVPFLKPKDLSINNRDGWVSFVKGDEAFDRTEREILDKKRALWKRQDKLGVKKWVQ